MPEWPPFSTDEFLAALADSYFPGATPAVVECEGQRFRTLLIGGKRAVSGFFPFPFYLEPLGPEADGLEAISVPYLAEVVIAITAAGAPGPKGLVPAPFVRLSDFDSWESLVRSSKSLPGVNSPARVLQKIRRIEREFGPLELCRDDSDADAFETIIRWKSAQYDLTWKSHRLSIERNVEFYRELWRRGMFKLTTLRVGGRPIAGKIGLYSDRRYLWRVTVYDPAMKSHSPGSIIEMESLRAAFEAGALESDYLMGDEAYKFTFATHIRWIGSIGREPRFDRWRKRGRMHVARIATRSPAIYRRLKALEARAGRLRRRG